MRSAGAVIHPDDLGPGLGLRFKKLSTRTVHGAEAPEDVAPVALAHNLRDGNDGHRHRKPIDPNRTPQNEVLRGPQSLVVAAELVRNMFEELGIVPSRKDNVMLVEAIFQPPDGHDIPPFWAECLSWASRRYQYVISFIIHRDQKRPHAHMLALAVTDGRLAGSDMTSGANRYAAQQSDFDRHMRQTLGLRMPDKRERKSKKPKTLEALALSTGKGAKTREKAAKRDAELVRLAGDEWCLKSREGFGAKNPGKGSRNEAGQTLPGTKMANPSIAQLFTLAPTSLTWAHLPASATPASSTAPPIHIASATEPAGAGDQECPAELPPEALATRTKAGAARPTTAAPGGPQHRAGGPAVEAPAGDRADDLPVEPTPPAGESGAGTRHLESGCPSDPASASTSTAPAASASPRRGVESVATPEGCQSVATESPAEPSATPPAPAAPAHGRCSVPMPSHSESGRPDDAADTGGFSRERDSDHLAGAWDAETGEFIKPPPGRGTPGKLAAQNLVRQWLGQRPIRP